MENGDRWISDSFLHTGFRFAVASYSYNGKRKSKRVGLGVGRGDRCPTGVVVLLLPGTSTRYQVPGTCSTFKLTRTWLVLYQVLYCTRKSQQQQLQQQLTTTYLLLLTTRRTYAK